MQYKRATRFIGWLFCILVSTFGVCDLFNYGLETGGGSALVKLFEVIVLVYGKLYSDAALPAGVFDGVHQFNAADTLLAVNEKIFLTEDSGGKVAYDASVLTAHTGLGF